MDYRKLERLLYQIITDRRFIRAKRSSGEYVDLMIRSLTPQETAYSKFIYDRALREARYKGLPTEKQCMGDAINMDLWSKDQDKLLVLYKQEIDRIEKLKETYAHNKGRSFKLRTDGIKARKKLEALRRERDNLATHSADTVARTSQTNYIISRILMDPIIDEQIWETYADFLQERDSKFINSVIQGYASIEHPTEAEFREVVRSGGWNIMWNTGKKAGNLFDKPTAHMTNDQLTLSYWSMVYDSVYESMDKPSDAIIADDAKLDKWFEDQEKKRASERKKSTFAQSSTDRHPEQFVMASNEDEADEIYEMNDKYALAEIRARTKKLEAKYGQFVDTIEINQGRIKKQLLTQHSDRLGSQRKASNSKRFLG